MALGALRLRRAAISMALGALQLWANTALRSCPCRRSGRSRAGVANHLLDEVGLPGRTFHGHWHFA
eukprot:929314-Heterocapsa_arctica.AAC.1